MIKTLKTFLMKKWINKKNIRTNFTYIFMPPKYRMVFIIIVCVTSRYRRA